MRQKQSDTTTYEPIFLMLKGLPKYSLNPLLLSTDLSFATVILKNAFPAILSVDAQKYRENVAGAITPGIARHVDVSPAKNVYTLELADAWFSDGTKVSTKDLMETIQLFVPESLAGHRPTLQNKNKKLPRWAVHFRHIKEIEVLSDSSLQIALDRSDPHFVFALEKLPILHKKNREMFAASLPWSYIIGFSMTREDSAFIRYLSRSKNRDIGSDDVINNSRDNTAGTHRLIKLVRGRGAVVKVTWPLRKTFPDNSVISESPSPDNHPINDDRSAVYIVSAFIDRVRDNLVDVAWFSNAKACLSCGRLFYDAIRQHSEGSSVEYIYLQSTVDIVQALVSIYPEHSGDDGPIPSNGVSESIRQTLNAINWQKKLGADVIPSLVGEDLWGFGQWPDIASKAVWHVSGIDDKHSRRVGKVLTQVFSKSDAEFTVKFVSSWQISKGLSMARNQLILTSSPGAFLIDPYWYGGATGLGSGIAVAAVPLFQYRLGTTLLKDWSSADCDNEKYLDLKCYLPQ